MILNTCYGTKNNDITHDRNYRFPIHTINYYYQQEPMRRTDDITLRFAPGNHRPTKQYSPGTTQSARAQLSGVNLIHCPVQVNFFRCFWSKPKDAIIAPPVATPMFRRPGISSAVCEFRSVWRQVTWRPCAIWRVVVKNNKKTTRRSPSRTIYYYVYKILRSVEITNLILRHAPIGTKQYHCSNRTLQRATRHKLIFFFFTSVF